MLRKSLFLAWCLSVGGFTLSSCTSAPPPSYSASFVHLLLFKAKGNTGETELVLQDFLKDARSMLQPIPSVRNLWPGRPVGTSPVPGVTLDDDYDVAILLLFDHEDGLNDYRNHPRHLDFKKKYEGLFEMRTIDFSPYGGKSRT